MGFFRRVCAKVVGLFRGRSSRRQSQLEEGDVTPRSSISSSEAGWEWEAEDDAPSQGIPAYLDNSGFNFSSTTDIRHCVEADLASICSVVCFHAPNHRFNFMSPNLNPLSLR
jgi:hypothetical protein